MTPTASSDEWVVRGGEAKAPDLISGYGPHPLVPGLYGFSVQYAPGKTVSELAQAGHFRNATISYETASVLARVVQSLGYEMRLVPSPGGGYHHTFAVLYDASKTLQTTLPSVIAQALAAAFRRTLNPHRAPAIKKAVNLMKRIHVDFNTMTSAPVDLVKLAGPGTWQARALPPLINGERVTLYDADGLEVEATVIHDAAGWWMATPDEATWRDMPISADVSVSPVNVP